jgi:hypothetical protein
MPQLVLAKSEIVSHLMEQRGANLAAHFYVIAADSLDVSLV